MAHPDHDPDVGDVLVVPWTAGLALRVVRQHEGAVGPAAIRACVTGGWVPRAAVVALAGALHWRARASAGSAPPFSTGLQRIVARGVFPAPDRDLAQGAGSRAAADGDTVLVDEP